MVNGSEEEDGDIKITWLGRRCRQHGLRHRFCKP